MSADRVKLEAGQRWAHPKGGPWPGHGSAAIILDVRDGWVRYSFCGNEDDRAEEAWFRSYFSHPIEMVPA